MQLTDNQTKVRDALPDEGAAAPTAIAETSGLGYSTVTRLLRELADAGLAVKETDGWRRTTSATDASDTEADSGPDVIKTEPDTATTDQVSPEGVAPIEPADDAGADEPEPVADHEPEDPTDVPDGSALETDDPDPATEPVVATPAADEPIADTADDEAGQSDADRRPRLHKGQLRDQVLAVLRAAEEPLGPTQMSKLLDGRSQGAIANACDKLVTAGDAIRTSEKPQRFAAAPTA